MTAKREQSKNECHGGLIMVVHCQSPPAAGRYDISARRLPVSD